MARTKYKLGQLIQGANTSGVINEIRIRETENEYMIDNGKALLENEVEAHYRKVTPRTKAVAPRAKKKKLEKVAA